MAANFDPPWHSQLTLVMNKEEDKVRFILGARKNEILSFMRSINSDDTAIINLKNCDGTNRCILLNLARIHQRSIIFISGVNKYLDDPWEVYNILDGNLVRRRGYSDDELK
jgi:hypothetical protein